MSCACSALSLCRSLACRTRLWRRDQLCTAKRSVSAWSERGLESWGTFSANPALSRLSVRSHLRPAAAALIASNATK